MQGEDRMTEEDRERMVRMETKLDANAKSLGILFKSIEGNGKLGLKDRMTGLEIMVGDHLRMHESSPQKQGNVIQWFILTIMIAAIVLNVVAG
jgi:hypothetical protein